MKVHHIGYIVDNITAIEAFTELDTKLFKKVL